MCAGQYLLLCSVDPLSESLLATMHAQPATEKKKRTMVLHNPTVPVEMTFSGMINFRWQFTWEDHTFEFRRNGECHQQPGDMTLMNIRRSNSYRPPFVECYLLRHPDPPVLVTVFDFEKKRDRAEVGLLQLLDYNLER